MWTHRIAIAFYLATAGLARAEAPAAPVPCKTIDDCWLDPSGAPIRRPRKLRKKAIPRGNCGTRLHWLRHVLSCEENVCTAKLIGDRC